MAGQDLVRPSRDGDQFHYHWAARRCLELLPRASDLVAVTIEGASVIEGDGVDAGEELIDVGLYFGAEGLKDARLVSYVQLKHSTRRAGVAWTASGLEKTIRGFAARFAELRAQFSADDVARRFRFEFTSNRPIDPSLREALAELSSGSPAKRPELHDTLVGYAGLEKPLAAEFFSLFVATGGEGDLWAQKNLLAQDLSAYLPDADVDAPVQLKELVTRKATSEFESDPSIRRYDVLRALKASEDALWPAPCLIADVRQSLAREQEPEILRALLNAGQPIVIHAEGGVGKSLLAARLAGSMPAGSEAVLYDCFGDGLYRNALGFRHRHRDALVQIANELAARGLCHPLIPSAHADVKAYMRAFVHRLGQAIRLLRARDQNASLCIIVDAADNAEMAAEEQGEAASFVRDLIRAPLPVGVRVAFTCRTHRRARLSAPPDALQIELRPFSELESGAHLRGRYPDATTGEVAEFAVLSSANPRVQALALSRNLSLEEMLKQLGPQPTTVERAIGELLEGAVARLRDQYGPAEAKHVDLVCEALAVLRPLVPIPVLAQLSNTSESAVRSFALDLGRPLFVKGESLHFMDEPAETWFRERFRPDAQAMSALLERLRPIAGQSSYAAAALPQLLLQAGKLDELVELALSAEGLPADPLAKRDVELQRLTFALKACLQQGRWLLAAKLALKAAGECAGEERQNGLIQANTDLAAVLMAPDRIEEIVARRSFSSGWMGSHHAYHAGFLSGRPELLAEASSRLRMALDWLFTWARLPEEERRNESVSDADRAELALAQLRVHGPRAAAGFLRRWRWRRHAFTAGRRLARRLLDIGRQDQVDALAEAAGNDVWLLLGLAVEARAVGHRLPTKPLDRLLRLLADRRVKLPESESWGEAWDVLDAVTATIETALLAASSNTAQYGAIVARYLPAEPPSALTDRFGFNRGPLLRAYALHAALAGKPLALADVAPKAVREQLENGQQYSRNQDTEIFLQEVGGRLPWYALAAEVVCGRGPADLGTALSAALKATSSAESRMYREGASLVQVAARQWLQILRDAGRSAGAERQALDAWLAGLKEPLWPDTLIALCGVAARAEGFAALAVECAANAFQALEHIREDAESRAASYTELARAILTVSPTEAAAYFDRAVEIANRIGDENLDRWAALLKLGEAAADPRCPRPRSAYRLSRVAELTYEYVARDKHFDWDATVEDLTDLCPASALAILSRWRDRRFGRPGRLLPIVISRLIEKGRLPAKAPIALAGVKADWERLAELKAAISAESDPGLRTVTAQVGYRYLRVDPYPQATWLEISKLGQAHGIDFADIDRLVAWSADPPKSGSPSTHDPGGAVIERRAPDWNAIFEGVDLTDSGALRAAYAAVRTHDPPYDFERFFREAFGRVRVGRESELVRAIAAWPDFEIFELRYLLDALPSPLPKAVAFRAAVREAVLSACRREPARVWRRGWAALIPFQKLDEDGVVPDADVVRATLEGYAAQVDTLGAGALFRAIEPLAASLSPAEADEALNYGLDLLDELLRPEDGDGDWRSDLEPPASLICALAGYIWAGLGSPVVAVRWQFAHAVRCIVELGWSDPLEALLGWARRDGAGAFVDQGLEFYLWHARQWLAIGLARAALDNPTALRPAAPLLRSWVEGDHVLLRRLGAQALQSLVSADVVDSSDAGDLSQVNRPALPETVTGSWGGDVEDEASPPDDAMSDDERYYFGIDIARYWFPSLGRAFGVTEGAIERRARAALRSRIGWKAGDWRHDTRYSRKIFDDREAYHSHGSLPKADDLQAYHGYHAMMLVAADLLVERSVRRREGERLNQFDDWLDDYLLTRADGRWLADRRDPRLTAEPPRPEGYSDQVWRWGVDAAYLDQQLATQDGDVVLWGHWLGGGDDHSETVSVRSALVSAAGSESLLAALQAAPELGRHVLPEADFHDRFEVGDFKLQGWIVDRSHSARLDEHDPWGEHLHYPGPAPSDEVLSALGLTASGDGRQWASASGVRLRSETWTHRRGYGREEETVSGWRLSANAVFFGRLYEERPADRLILSVAVSRQPPRHGGGEDEFEAYPWPYERYYLMGADGVALPL